MNQKSKLLIIIIIIILFLIRNIIRSIYFMMVNNIKMKGFFSYAFLYNEIFIQQDYNLPVKDGMTIFDVGANIGLFNLYMNQKAKNLTIYSFEPVSQIFECLKHNIPNNNSNLAINKGLGDKNETITMNYLKNASAMSSGCSFDKEKLQAHENIYTERCGILKGICKAFLEKQMLNPKKITAQITTISDIIDQYNISKIDIIKIDVECYELNVIKGIRPEHFDRIDNIIFEIENFRKEYKEQIIHILQNNHFKIKGKHNNDNWIMIHAHK